MITESRLVIAIPNLTSSSDYYQNVLGFEIKALGDDGWLIYQKGAACIMAGECPNATPPDQLGDHSYFAYFIMDSLSDYYEKVVAAGGEIVKPLKVEPWGMQEFGVKTIDGHRIMFGCEKPLNI